MFFGSKSKTETGSPDALPANTAPLPAVSSSGSMDSDSVKKAIIQQVLLESNTNNVRQLLDHCFEKCVPKPGASLTSGEQTCASQCMDKYIAAWNTVNSTYMRRIQQQVGNN